MLALREPPEGVPGGPQAVIRLGGLPEQALAVFQPVQARAGRWRGALGQFEPSAALAPLFLQALLQGEAELDVLRLAGVTHAEYLMVVWE